MWMDASVDTFSWLLDTPLDVPYPPGLKWMTPDELDGYYLLFSDVVPTPGFRSW